MSSDWGRCDCSRRCAITTSAAGAGEAVPGGVVGDVRQGGGESAARDHAVSSAQSLRVRQGLCALADGQLSRGVRAVRVQRNSVQPRVAQARRKFRDAQDHAQRDPNQTGHAGEARARQPRCAARLGICRRLRRGDVADAAAGEARRLRGRDRRESFGAGISGSRVRSAETEMAGPCRDRSAILPSRGSRSVDR